MPAQNVSMMFSPYSAEAQDIERRRRIAEALQMQSMQPIEQQPTPAGGFAVPISPMQGFAKIAQALAAGYGKKQAGEQSKALWERYAKDRSSVIAQAEAAGEGAPAQPGGYSGEIGDELYTPEKAAVSADRRKVYQALAAQSNFPELQTLGITEMLKEEKFGHEPRFTADGKPYLISDKGAVKWLDPASVTPRVKMEPLTNVAGPSGPQTQFYNPYNPPKTPVSQAVKSEVGPAGQFYNPYQQQPGSVLQDPNRPFQATPGGGQQPNLPYQQYEKEKAAAGRPQVSVRVGSEKKYAEERSKAAAQRMADFEKAAESAHKANEGMDRFLAASATGSQGSLQPLFTGVQNVLASFGYQSKDLVDVRQMEQAIGDVLQNKMSELGARGLTDRDMEILRVALPRVDIDRAARQNVADIVKKANNAIINEYMAQRKEEERIYPDLAQRIPKQSWLRRYEQGAGLPSANAIDAELRRRGLRR